MSAQADRRIGLFFELLDVDRNGRIDVNDFALLAERLVKSVPDGRPEAREALVAACRSFWTALAAESDADGDATVTVDEFRASVSSPGRFAEVVEEYADAVAGYGDPDGDGLVTRVDFVAMTAAAGFDRGKSGELFDVLSASSDRVPREVWYECIRDYYTGARENTPGNVVVG
ncbi:EF-hand domain-containing protein [Actinosynnema sp. NPDC023587]|uniref:EF-hand domain-containing protein n=1 Tax=Actinosynnema sp. NPDC023587 TaxID=3154695 RepID=UPI0033C65A6C